jgi:hypothetical protein
LDAGGGGAAHIIEFPGLGIDVIFGVIAVQFFAANEVFEVDVAAGLGIAGFGVVIQFVGLQQHIRGLQAHGAAKVADGSFGVLSDGLNVNVVGVGGTGVKRANFDVGISAGGNLRKGSG